jgi:hypothetical protein
VRETIDTETNVVRAPERTTEYEPVATSTRPETVEMAVAEIGARNTAP